MRYVEIDESYKLDELLGFGKKKKEKSAAAAPTPAAEPEKKPEAPAAKDPLKQQWDSTRSNVNQILAKGNAKDVTLQQFVADMKEFAMSMDDAFQYIDDPRAFNHVAKTAAQHYVRLEGKYFSKNKSAALAQGASSKLGFQGQDIFAEVRKELLPYFKALRKRIA